MRGAPTLRAAKEFSLERDCPPPYFRSYYINLLNWSTITLAPYLETNPASIRIFIIACPIF
jgi:hypothetical protein